MKYSNIIITDDNMDEEVEKLQDYKGSEYMMFEYDRFVEGALPAGFTKHENADGIEEWSDQQTHDGYADGKLAFEFANGFLIMAVGNAV